MAWLLFGAPELPGLPGYIVREFIVGLATLVAAINTMRRPCWAVHILAVASFISYPWMVLFTVGASMARKDAREYTAGGRG